MGSPPFPQSHPDLGVIEGKKPPLFGPSAVLSTRVLKHRKPTDVMASLAHDDVVPLLDGARPDAQLGD